MLDLLRAIPQSQMLEKAQACFGMDLTSDVSSYTAYGKNFVPDGGVLIVRGKLNRAKLLTLLQTIPTLKTVNVHQHDVFIWTETDPQNAAKPGHESAAVLLDDHTVVLAHDLQLIGDVPYMLDGKGKIARRRCPLRSLRRRPRQPSSRPEQQDSRASRNCRITPRWSANATAGCSIWESGRARHFFMEVLLPVLRKAAHQLQALLVGLQAACNSMR